MSNEKKKWSILDGIELSNPEEMEELDEAAALQDVAHMPARVKCAVLGWHTMEEMFDLDKQQDAKQ